MQSYYQGIDFIYRDGEIMHWIFVYIQTILPPDRSRPVLTVIAGHNVHSEARLAGNGRSLVKSWNETVGVLGFSKSGIPVAELNVDLRSEFGGSFKYAFYLRP